MRFWAGAQVLKSVGCQKQKPPWKVSGAVGWLHDTARGAIFEYIPHSVFLFASFSRGILLSSWLIPCQSGQPTRTAMKRSVIFLPMGKELRCYNVTAQPFPASARCFLLYPRATVRCFLLYLRASTARCFLLYPRASTCFDAALTWQSWHKSFVPKLVNQTARSVVIVACSVFNSSLRMLKQSKACASLH